VLELEGARSTGDGVMRMVAVVAAVYRHSTISALRVVLARGGEQRTRSKVKAQDSTDLAQARSCADDRRNRKFSKSKPLDRLEQPNQGGEEGFLN
jgi:hypothetical protein